MSGQLRRQLRRLVDRQAVAQGMQARPQGVQPLAGVLGPEGRHHVLDPDDRVLIRPVEQTHACTLPGREDSARARPSEVPGALGSPVRRVRDPRGPERRHASAVAGLQAGQAADRLLGPLDGRGVLAIDLELVAGGAAGGLRG